MAFRKRRRKSTSKKTTRKSRKSSKSLQKRKSKVQHSESLTYDNLELKQLLATLDLSGNNLTIEGNSDGNQVYLRVNGGELEWSEDGVTYSNDLDEIDANTQNYVMDPANPLNVTINMNNELDEAFINIGGVAGLGNVTVTDGDAIDSVTIQSDLDLLPTGGSLNINVESVTVSNSANVAAPSGITIDATLDGQVTIENNALLSTRNIAPGGDHQTDPSVADSANIEIKGETIQVGDDTNILANADSGFANGNVNIEAESALPLIVDLNDIDLSTAANILDFVTPHSDASVDIGSATIRGAEVTISAEVTADADLPEAADIVDEILNDGGPLSALLTAGDYVSGEIDEFLTGTTSIPVVYISETTSATVDIGENAMIDATRDVNISATTNSSESSVVETEVQSLAVTKVDSTSEVNIENGTQIRAQGDINVTTDTTISSTTDSKTHKNLNEVDGDKTAIALAISKSNLVSHIKIDVNTILRASENITVEAKGDNTTTSKAEGGVYRDGGVGAAVALNFPNSSVRADVDGTLRASVNDVDATSGGIVILADLTANEDAQAVTGLGGVAPEGVEIETVPQIEEIIDNWIVPVIDYIQGLNIVNLTSLNLNIATAVALNETSNSAVAEIGTDAVLQSNLDIDVDSKLSDTSRTFAESVDRQPSDNDPEDHITIALVVGLYDNNSQAIFEDGSTADAKRNLSVDAKTEYPFQPTVEENNDTGFYEIKGNSWARSQSENAKSDYAGAVNYQEHHNNTEARIGDGAQINQNFVFSDPDQSVTMQGDAQIILLDIAGLFELDIDADALQTLGTTVGQAVYNGGDVDLSLDTLLEALKTGFQQVISDSEIALGTAASETAIGGAFTFTNMFDTTSATIGENAKVNTGQNGLLDVRATSDIKHYVFSGAGFKANNVGVEGSLVHNRHQTDTIANIGSGSVINAGPSLSVAADSQLEKYGFAGGVFFDAKRGVGVSAATNNVERNTLAYIGSADDTYGDDVDINALNRLNVTATSSGNTIALALSGTKQGNSSITTQSPTNSASNSGEVSADFADNSQQGSYGLAVSADIASNRSDAHNTQAFINNGGTIDARSISVGSRDTTAFYAGAGAAAFQPREGHHSSFSGSYSRNRITGSVQSWINGANLTTTNDGLTVSANHDSKARILAAAVGLARANDTAFSGSFVFNNVDWQTTSTLADVTAVIDGNTSITARDESSATTIAGAGTWTARNGLGVSFTRNAVDYTTLASLRGSDLQMTGSFTANTVHDANFTAIAASFSTGDSFTFTGTVAINSVDGHVETSTIDTHLASDSVSLTANDNSRVRAFSGAVSAFGETIGLGFGGAYSGNHVDQNVYAFANATTMNSLSSASITANSEMNYNAIALGGAQQNNFALAISVSENKVNKNLKANAESSAITATDDIRLEAIDNSDLGAYGADFALANLAFGASIGLNQADTNVESRGLNSTFQSLDGDVKVDAHDDTSVNAVSIGGAFGQLASFGGSLSKNDIATDVVADLTNTPTGAVGDISVDASNTSSIFALSGGLAGGSGAAVGAAVGLNSIESDVSAAIVDSGIGSLTGAVNVTGQNESEIQSLTAGGAGAGSFALGGSVSTNDVDTNIDVHITDSMVVAPGDVDVSATNNGQIWALSGGLAGAGGVSFGAAYSQNNVSSDIRSCVENSTVISNTGDIDLSSDNNSHIKAIALGGVGAGAFALGGSVTVNRIDTNICTCVVDGSVLEADSEVSVASRDHSTIQAFAGGAAGSGAVAVGIAVVDNDVDRTIKSEIVDSDVTSQTDSTRVTVSGRSTQTGNGIGASGSGVVAASGSIVTNRLDQNIKASIDGDSDVNSGRHVDVIANYSDTLTSNVVTLSGSGFVSAGASVSTNKIDQTMESFIGTDTVVNAAGNVLVRSNDSTSVNAVVGQASGSGIAAVGTSISNVQIHKDVDAYIDHEAQVYTDADIDEVISVYDGDHNGAIFGQETIYGVGVQSTSNENISNSVFAANGAPIVGVSGAVSVEIVKPHVEAWIGRNAIVEAGDPSTRDPNNNDPKRTETNVNVSAHSNTNVDALTGGLGFGISGVGVSGAVDVGKIQHHVWGHIDEGAQVTGEDDIDVHGLSDKTVESDTVSLGGALGVGVAGSVSVWNIGPQQDSNYNYDGNNEDALLINGSQMDQFVSDQVDSAQQIIADHLGETVDGPNVYDDLNEVDPAEVKATVLKSANLVAGDDVDVRAREDIEVDQFTGGLSVGIASAGRSVGITNVDSDIEGTVFGNIQAGDDVLVQGTADDNIETKSLAGQISGIGWVGAIAEVNDSSEQTARISNDASITSADNVTVEATAAHEFDATTGEAAIGLGGAFGGSFASIVSNGTTEAYIANANIHGVDATGGGANQCSPNLATVTNVNVLTDVDQNFNAKATALSAGIVEATSAGAGVYAYQGIRTWIGEDANIHTKKDVTVQSDSNISATSDQLGVTPLSVASMGIAASVAYVRPAIDTFVSQSHLCVGNELTIQSNNDSNADVEGQSVVISVIAGQGVDAIAHAKPSVRTFLAGGETTVGNNAVVGSDISQTADAEGKGFSVGFGVGSGEVVGTADASGSATTFIGQAADVTVGNDLTIETNATGYANAETTSPTFAVGAANVGSDATAKASHNALALHSNAASMNVGGDMTVRSTSERDAISNAKGLGVGIIAAGGTGHSTAEANGITRASVTGQVDSTETLTVEALENNFTKADGKATAGGLLTGSGIESRTQANPTVASLVNSEVHAQDVVMNAEAHMVTRANGKGLNIGGINDGKITVEANVAPLVESRISRLADVTTEGDITMTAEQSLAAPAGEKMVTGIGGQGGFIGNTSLSINATSDPTVRTQIDSEADVTGRDLTMDASAINVLSAEDSSLSIGVLVAGGKSESNLNNGGTVTSRINGNIGNIHNVTVNSSADANAIGESAAGGGALVASNSGAEANVTVDPTIASIIDTNITATGDINVESVSLGNAHARAEALNISGVFGRGDTESNATVDSSVESQIAARRTVNARGELNVEARHNRNEDGTLVGRRAYAFGQSAQVALGLSSNKVEANATSTPDVKARIMDGANASAVDGMTVKAESFSEADVDGDGKAFGIIAGAGKVIGTANANGVTEAGLHGTSTVSVGQGDLDIIADDRSDAHAEGTGRSDGIVGSGGAVEMTARSTPDVDAYADSKFVTVAGDFDMIAASSGDVSAEGEERGGSILFNGGSVEASGLWQPNVLSQVEFGTQITAGNDLSVKAYGNHTLAGVKDTARDIFVDTVSKGTAIFGGRAATSNIVAAPQVHARVDGGANLSAGNHLILQARSYVEADADSFSRLFGLGSSDATSVVLVLMSTRAETLNSSNMINLNAGGTILFDSRSCLDADAYAKAKGPNKFAFAMVSVAQMHTFAFMSGNTNAVAGGNIHLIAVKDLTADADTTSFLGGSLSIVSLGGVSTAAQIFGASTFAGGSIITQVIDPVIVNANALVELDPENPVSEREWMEMLERGEIFAESRITSDVSLESGFDLRSKLRAERGVFVINQLDEFSTNANATLESPRGKFVPGTEEVRNRVQIETLNPKYRSFRRVFDQLCSGANYNAEVYQGRRSYAFERFDDGCGRGNDRSAGNGFNSGLILPSTNDTSVQSEGAGNDRQQSDQFLNVGDDVVLGLAGSIESGLTSTDQASDLIQNSNEESGKPMGSELGTEIDSLFGEN